LNNAKKQDKLRTAYFFIIMEIILKKGNLATEVCDVLILGLFSSKEGFKGTALFDNLDKELNGFLSLVAKEEKFTGKAQQSLWIRGENQKRFKRVLLVGLGEQENFTQETRRLSSAQAYALVSASLAKNVSMELLGGDLLDKKESVQAHVEGLKLAAYGFYRYKKGKKQTLKTWNLLIENGKDLPVTRKALLRAEQFVAATLLTRDLVNTPGMHMNPEHLVEEARRITRNQKNLKIKIYDKKKLEGMQAGGILAVAQGSEHVPYLVHMTYTPTKPTKKRIALIGKGVTFDSGGLSLKPADYMMSMKADMGGAATVLGVFSQIVALSPQVEVHGIFAAVENMPSAQAVRPGDVITMMNKKTVEVLNTDAEGRLILADSLVYASQLKPDLMIDLATLTGACLVALGDEITGIMSNTPELAGKLKACADESGESMWELPLPKSYKKMIKGDISDLKNIGGRYGGAITAGLFLQEFVGSLPWAHLDIAGPAYAEREINAYTKKGATGHGVRTLLHYLSKY